MSRSSWPNRSSSRRRVLARYPAEPTLPAESSDDVDTPNASAATLQPLEHDADILNTEDTPLDRLVAGRARDCRPLAAPLVGTDAAGSAEIDCEHPIESAADANKTGRQPTFSRGKPQQIAAVALSETRQLLAVERMIRSDTRVRTVVVGLLLFWGVLATRLVQLQYVKSRDYAVQAQRQHSQSVVIPARPGDIVDRRGRLLTTTVACRSLYVVPRRITDPAYMAQQLAEVLSLSEQEILQRIARHRTKHFLWIKRQLTAKQAEQIEQLDLDPATFGFQEEYRREYPQGRLAAHVLGLRDIDGVGRGGLEQAFDSILGGKAGTWWHRRDAHGRVIDVQTEPAVTPIPGQTLVVTLDSVIQLYVEQELDRAMTEWKPLSACAIVMAVKTGEVLAMASRPNFDPRHPLAGDEAAWNNTCLASVYEPGSTFKPLIVADAMQAGLLSLEEQFDCENGEYRMGKRLLHDHHPYGLLSVTDVLVKSSNIGMAKIGERMGNQRLYDATLAFGFGRKTGINLPGEIPGLLRPLKEWNSYSTGSIPMGQELAATPLQVVTAHAALANGGRWQTPRLFRGTLDPASGKLVEQPENLPRHGLTMRIVDPEIARRVIEGPMVAVVQRGTGRKAQLPGYAVFGKSGTSQKTDPQTGAYSNRLHVSSFICGAPAEDPEVLVLFIVDQASTPGDHYGGRIAAPAAAAILQKTLVYLRVPASTSPPSRQPAQGDLAESERDELL